MLATIKDAYAVTKSAAAVLGLPDIEPCGWDCPDDSELAGFLDRTLSRPRVRALEDHFDVFRECRELAYVLAALDPLLARRDEAD